MLIVFDNTGCSIKGHKIQEIFKIIGFFSWDYENLMEYRQEKMNKQKINTKTEFQFQSLFGQIMPSSDAF